jgi:ketosteroid isomerase-like protein
MRCQFVQHIVRPSALAVFIFTATTDAVSICFGGGEEIVTAIRAVLRAQELAWNHGDIDGFMNGYARAKSTIFVSEDKVTRGWETVRERYHKKYSDRAKMGTLTFSDLEITPFSGDTAIALGRWQLRRAGDQLHGRFTLIFRLTNDGWRIVHDHTSAAPPPR